MTLQGISERSPLELKNDRGLLVNARSNTVLGYLFEFSGGGVFSPDGKVQVTAEAAAAHNNLLSQGEILGLDQNCQVGQRGTFYYRAGSVVTWMGELVSNDVTVRGRVITFRRAGKAFRGRLCKDAECFHFRRIL